MRYRDAFFFFFFPWCKCGVFQCYMKGCRGRLTCLPLIYCLLSWNGRMAGVRTKMTQQGAKPKSTAGFSCISCCSTQSDLIGDALPVSSEEGWINVLLFWELTWDARANSCSPLVFTSTTFLLGSTWFLLSTDLGPKEKSFEGDFLFPTQLWCSYWNSWVEEDEVLLVNKTKVITEKARAVSTACSGHWLVDCPEI